MLRFGALLAATLLTSSVAVASSPESPTEPRKFYGWQVIVTQYAGQALVIHGFFSDGYMPIIAGGSTWLVGGAAVHAAHGNGAAAFASPFIQASPFVLALIGSQLAERRDQDDVAALAIVVGAIATPLLDGFVLGWETSQPRAPTSTSLKFAPHVARDRLGLSLGGQF